MSDLISRQDAEKVLDSHRYEYENKHLNDYEQGWNDAIDYAVDEWLDELSPVQPEQRWIPCSEGLPKLGIRYNVTYESGEVGYADFRNKVIYGDKCIEKVWDIPEYYEDDGQVVAWMHLPEPYKAERWEG